ncbi:hypothetical protein PYCC9005_005547 [Savitreella phatthalungensis]
MPSSSGRRIETSDFVILFLVAVATIAYFTKGKLWAKPKTLDLSKTSAGRALANGHAPGSGKSRSIVEKMKASDKNCVVFYGSQTGTAEDYAGRLAKEGHRRFGLKTMIADMEEYDYDDLDEFPEDAVACFVVATYGEGEPTDNAVAFFDFIKSEDSTIGSRSAEDAPLANLKYVTFGLGNKTYEHYNEVVKICDTELTRWGAQRVGTVGMGDDGDGSMEEDYLAWKETMWVALTEVMSLEERETSYEPAFDVVEDAELTTASSEVFLGEPSKKHLTRAAKPYNANNPFLAPVAQARELFTVKDRHCLHIEFDLSNSGIKYKTGDHIAVWPTNPDVEVDRLERLLGLENKRDTVVKLKALDTTAKVPVPQPSTYDSILRYYLEINAAVSRQFLSTLVQFAPNDSAKQELTKLSQDREYFHAKVALPHLNLAQLMESLAPSWPNLPFSIFLETFSRLQPRYYSISSSNVASPSAITITAVVESQSFAGHENILHGVTTNYLLALAQHRNGATEPHPHGLTYKLDGPRDKYAGGKVPVHVRQSNFRLPSEPSVPIVMIGPGTGVAPFRAFVQERAEQSKEEGVQVGKSILFYGCRKAEEDYIYQKEWQEYKGVLGDSFDLDVAFSRQTPGKKVYVQHRLADRAAEVKQLLLEHGAFFYICGDAANMAREVNAALVSMIGEDQVKQLRASGRLQEDVWS